MLTLLNFLILTLSANLSDKCENEENKSENSTSKNQSYDTTLSELKQQDSDDLFTITIRFKDFSSAADILCDFSFILEFIQSNVSGIDVTLDCGLEDDALNRDKILKQYGALKRAYILLFRQSNEDKKLLYWKAKDKKTVNYITFEATNENFGNFIINFTQKSIKNGESGKLVNT